MSFDKSWDDNVYSQGKALNRYPYGELTSTFFQSLKYLNPSQKREEMKVLEIACGAGNNLWFIKELGFDVYGIDGSDIAIEAAKKTFQERSLTGHFQKAFFDNLPFENNSFDILIDRSGTVCNTAEGIIKTWQEASRVLKPSGMFIALMFNDNHPSFRYATENPDSAEFLSERTISKITKGDLVGLGITTFVNLDDIKELFKFGEIKQIKEHSSRAIHPKEGAEATGYSEYIVVGVKNGN